MALSAPLPRDREIAKRLLEAAASEFARHGLAAARIRDIVDAAGANVAAVNYYFGGKEGLYRATLEMLVRRSREEGADESPELRAMPPEDRLRVLMRVILGRVATGERPNVIGRVLAHELLDPTPCFHLALEGIAGPQIGKLGNIVRACLGPKATDEDVDFSALSVLGQWSLFLFGMPAIAHVYPALSGDGERLDRISRELSDFAIAALRTRRAEIEIRKGRKKPVLAKPASARGRRRRAPPDLGRSA